MLLHEQILNDKFSQDNIHLEWENDRKIPKPSTPPG